eukprot:CAMPEP_0172826346 /NCGR_PEP_ID=MMETSP1075-20121228/19359_1 /TAXON_ID=2916 /ORGANISM="Ceratium fusus, Strain PA161109" /LENGTH=70 /DNA_ID=CAMNT_0013667989 /DNA_START=351 /DNA_END=561 /DNA_ORIENTATION=+
MQRTAPLAVSAEASTAAEGFGVGPQRNSAGGTALDDILPEFAAQEARSQECTAAAGAAAAVAAAAAAAAA